MAIGKVSNRSAGQIRSPSLKEEGIVHYFDHNGGLVVDRHSLLTNPAFRRQIKAAARIGVLLKQKAAAR
jgi:hypothetical protein